LVIIVGAAGFRSWLERDSHLEPPQIVHLSVIFKEIMEYVLQV
jgi:hypothetical protein